jgi:hypothetical protein
MKKVITLILLGFMLIPATYAQKGLQLGANFNYLSSSIVNQNVWGIGREYDYKISTNTSFGLDVGYNFNDRMGVYTGFWMTNLGQGYSDEYAVGEAEANSVWERDIKLKYNVIPLMLRFSNSFNRVNFLGGIGVSFAFLNTAEQTWTQDGAVYTETFENPITEKEFIAGATDVTDRFAGSDIFLNLELGARIFLIDELYLDASFFGGYGIKDINAEDWKIENKDGEYKGSHNAFGGIKVGIAYVLFND